jgi:hypothetical protein
MIEVLFEIIPFAVGIAISPVPIITVILSLFSVKAVWNGPAFLLGWAMGILVVCIPVLMFTESTRVTTVTNPSTLASVVRVILGGLLFIAAFFRWRVRPKANEEPNIPKWLLMVEVISPFKVFVVGFFFAVITNPKNMALTIAGILPVAHSFLSIPEKTALVALFIIVSCLGIAIPVIYYLVAGETARNILNAWKKWLIVNNRAVVATLLLVFGVILFSEGMKGLLP